MVKTIVLAYQQSGSFFGATNQLERWSYKRCAFASLSNEPVSWYLPTQHHPARIKETPELAEDESPWGLATMYKSVLRKFENRKHTASPLACKLILTRGHVAGAWRCMPVGALQAMKG